MMVIEPVAEADPRDRLYRLIGAYPGLHLRELARQASISEALAGYHMRHFVSEGLIEGVEDGNYLRLFATQGRRPRDPDQQTIAVLRQRIPLQIVLLLLERKAATHGEIASELDLAKSTASYHLAKLVEHGVVADAAGRAFAVRDRTHIMRLLDTWRPTSALSENFEATWAGLYGGKAIRKRRL